MGKNQGNILSETSSNGLSCLIGKKVLRILFNNEKNSFIIVLENSNPEKFNCEGECCSESWIEHISGLQNLIGHVVTKIQEICIDTDKDYGEERTLIYRFDIFTEEGICTLEMRNFNNGYYSGNLTREGHNDGYYNHSDEFEVPTIECNEDF